MFSFFRRPTRPGPKVFSNLAAGEPKKNIRVCCNREGRTVLFCEECHGRGYEYLEIRHHDSCNTAQALVVAEIHPTSDPVTAAI